MMNYSSYFQTPPCHERYGHLVMRWYVSLHHKALAIPLMNNGLMVYNVAGTNETSLPFYHLSSYSWGLPRTSLHWRNMPCKAVLTTLSKVMYVADKRIHVQFSLTHASYRFCLSFFPSSFLALHLDAPIQSKDGQAVFVTWTTNKRDPKQFELQLLCDDKLVGHVDGVSTEDHKFSYPLNESVRYVPQSSSNPASMLRSAQLRGPTCNM
jgi:hypothetical protein